MQKSRWFCPLFDIVGLLSLTCAIVALGGAVWFVDVVSETLLFSIFHVCLAAAVTSFVISRLAEIFRVISRTPDPRRLRGQTTATAGAAPLAIVADGDEKADNKFPRAA